MDRRVFCISGAALACGAGVALYPAWAARAGIPARPSAPGAVETVLRSIDTVVFDTRFEPSRAFGAAAVGTRLATLPIHGDVTPLWRDLFRGRRRPTAEGGADGAAVVAGMAVAGMTTEAGLLCLEQLAMDRWLRVVARIEHRRGPAGAAHRVTADSTTSDLACTALREASDWGASVCGVLASTMRATNEPRVMRIVGDWEPFAGAGRADDLVSWIIA